MLKQIEGLPSTILGLSAEGKVAKDDYETVLIPLLETERRQGRRVRFLYQFGSEFSEFTAGAAPDDFRVGLKYLRLFERCAIVTDVEWIRVATHFLGSFMPCPVQVFKNAQLKDAIEWLASPAGESKLRFELKEDRILIVYPQGPLKREDFAKLASIVDPWIEAHNNKGDSGRDRKSRMSGPRSASSPPGSHAFCEERGPFPPCKYARAEPI